ncbi:protein phosphatase 2C domain-containing protein [soil metagenome]
MKLGWQTLSVPKAGNTPEQNEDALAVSKETLRAAVCDGASEGWRSGPWAAHLANSLVNAQASPRSFAEWLAFTRASTAMVAAPVMSWYAEAKQATGSFSTLLSVSFGTSKDGGLKYQAVAVGDTELIHRRGDQIVTKFPLEKSADFSNRTALVGNLAESGDPTPEWFAGRAEAGDVFYLMTDALAEWFLRTREAGEEPWTSLDAVTSAIDAPAEYAHWVQSLRQSKAMKNDDATLVRISVV